jgi:hypothetical protein
MYRRFNLRRGELEYPIVVAVRYLNLNAMVGTNDRTTMRRSEQVSGKTRRWAREGDPRKHMEAARERQRGRDAAGRERT